MRKINIVFLSLLFLFLFQETKAQTPTWLAYRYIKAGNTLRQAGDYEKAEQLLNLASQNLAIQQDPYAMATIYEHKGLLYRAKGDEIEAQKYLKMAIQRFEAMQASYSSNALTDLLNNPSNANVTVATLTEKRNEVKVPLQAEFDNNMYAGVDIGTKNMKPLMYKFDKDYAKNEKVQNISLEIKEMRYKDNVDYLFNTLSTWITYFNKQGVPNENIFFVISSGNPMNNRDKIIGTQLKDKIKSKHGILINTITGNEEGRLVAKSQGKDMQRDAGGQAWVLDIGSGNTKGGYSSDISQNQWEGFSVAGDALNKYVLRKEIKEAFKAKGGNPDVFDDDKNIIPSEKDWNMLVDVMEVMAENKIELIHKNIPNNNILLNENNHLLYCTGGIFFHTGILTDLEKYKELRIITLYKKVEDKLIGNELYDKYEKSENKTETYEEIIKELKNLDVEAEITHQGKYGVKGFQSDFMKEPKKTRSKILLSMIFIKILSERYPNASLLFDPRINIFWIKEYLQEKYKQKNKIN